VDRNRAVHGISEGAKLGLVATSTVVLVVALALLASTDGKVHEPYIAPTAEGWVNNKLTALA
jgi:hypothetical protein